MEVHRLAQLGGNPHSFLACKWEEALGVLWENPSTIHAASHCQSMA